jgi:predicted SAM-dependent methyltransferase
MRKVLNVGSAHKGIGLPALFDHWEQIRLDIDPAMEPDIVGDARDMINQQGEQVDAIYCSHNLEHFHRHEVPVVLRGMLHLLKPGGFCLLAVPDLLCAVRAAAENGLDCVLYDSPAGPITAMDMIYGRAAMIAANEGAYCAHKTGFSHDSLVRAVREAGFERVELQHGDEFTIVAVGYRAQQTGA